MKTSSFRILLLSIALVLVVAGCSTEPTSEGAATTTADTAANTVPATTMPPPTAPPTVATTEAPRGPTELSLSPVTPDPDPDPKLTLLPLESVLVEMVDEYLIVTFGVPEFGLDVGFDDSEGNTVTCGTFEGVSSCGVFLADGLYESEEYDLTGLDFDESQVALRAVLDGPTGTITVEINGVAYVGETVGFMDGPLFVQFDVNTGGFANEVTRIQGEATATELLAALS